jgi:integrase-like protein
LASRARAGCEAGIGRCLLGALLLELALGFAQPAALLRSGRLVRLRGAGTVQLLEPVRLDLAEWQLATGRPGPDALVFPRRDGKPWTLTDWQNWRRRVYIPAGEAAGIAKARPYDLRHSFVSLLIHEGRSVVEIARQAGHAPTMTLGTYAHVFDEFALEDRLPAEEQIRRARAKDVPVSHLKDGGRNRRARRNACKGRVGGARLERATSCV